MPFEPITHIKINQFGKNKGKPISKNTVKIYKKLLDRLADAEIDTKDKLAENQEQVIVVIEAVVDADDEDGRALKRQYYSAIFYALDEYPLETKKLYYDYFQKAKQNYDPKKKAK